MCVFTKEQLLILDIICGKDISNEGLQSVDWGKAFEEAKRQSIASFLYYRIKRYAAFIPQSIENEWRSYSYANLSQNTKAIRYQRNMIELLNEHEYKYAIIKGTSAAIFWPEPQLRPFGDCDFLIDETQKEEIEECFICDGYCRMEQDHPCHVVFKKNDGSHLEMHYETVGIPNGKPGELVRQYMKDALVCTQKGNVLSNSFSMLMPKYHGAVLLLHMQHHMLSEGIGLRHLLDWGYFVSNTYCEAFWKKELLPFLQDTGMFVFAQSMTKTSAKYCGTYCPEWALDADDDLCEQLIKDILLGGNFGRKNPERSQSGGMISQHGKNGTQQGVLGNLVLSSKNSIMREHRITKRIPVLIPFFILWHGVLFAGRVMFGKRESFFRQIKYADDRRKIYSKLHLFEIE